MKLTSFTNLLAAAFVVSAAAGVAVSCQQDPAGPETTDLGETTDLVIPVSVEGAISCDDPSTPSTKVTVNPTTGVTAWETNDPIAVYVSGTGANTYVKAPVVSNSIRLSLTSAQSRANYAIAPWSCAPASGYTTPQVVYPNSYDMAAKDLTSANSWAPIPMVATNSGSELHFFHVGGLIRLHVTEIPTGTTALRVTFTGLDSPNYVAGTFTVNNPGTITASTTYATSGGQNYIDFTNLSISNQEVYLNIPVPTINMSGLTSIQVKATGGTTITTTKAVSGWGSITHGLGKKVDVSFLSITHEAGYTGKFRGYEISPGYLIWDTTTGAYTLSSPDDPLLPLRYYGGDVAAAQNIIVHQWSGTANSIYARLNGGILDTQTATKYQQIPNNDIVVDGLYWEVPNTIASTSQAWKTIFQGAGSPASSVNGTTLTYTNYYKTRVLVNLSDAKNVNGYDYSSKGMHNSSGEYQTGNNGGYQAGVIVFPDGITVTCSSITNVTANNLTDNRISYSDLQKLLDAGCLFFPFAGYMTKAGVWAKAGEWVLLWAAGQYNATAAINLRFTDNGYTCEDSMDKQTYEWVHLVRQ